VYCELVAYKLKVFTF